MELALQLLQSASVSGAKRIVVAIAGIPGSGKSFLASSVVQALTDLGESAVVLPMDGFHLSRAQLDKLENPSEAHRLRGAPFTFDAHGLVSLVNSLKTQTAVIRGPSFDHSVGDPCVDGIEITPTIRFILVEGLYLHLSLEPWNQMHFDVRWFLLCPKEVALARLTKRHFEAGVEETLELAAKRATESDMMNGTFILENRVACDLEIKSG
ncbi:P-loop containing nucleoside triphosphate hydrolase protein [Obelidium mucronatum]|nr:P-loop containing nucleoside triphosphate hydrolase protein [Obelidium mucronatum]